ncbi:hypothetical protein P175DRAFT_0433970 [Aspergillus ochraceoroseus IBT 24754]|uniref:SWR1-complex protein 5 n=2 Tax=Aspergillus ochraceoroseus TaxID=138278 RepID=A0A2T5M2R8_9EURO|nr:uncharacterized protein P175DRAFT_0433970 [Aspergillus ochraceoroseus IBT 24754]PTU22822.1 hypothetical protein P175DRAFT_0433970 [Aspergillus ochraceoroseus IBT 24754]
MPPDTTATMADAGIDFDEEQYDSADDEDFTLDQAAQEDEDAELSSSESENEATAGEPDAKRRKTKATTDKIALDGSELDSGDEAMIRKAKEKKQKQKQKHKGKGKGRKGSDEEDEAVDFDDDEEGGAGGFVKTRAMRMQMQEERKPLARIDGATIDVDAIWAQMNAPNQGLTSSELEKDTALIDGEKEDVEMHSQENIAPASQEKRSLAKYSEGMIKIKRTYKFAGETITEEKLVPRDSAEAKLFMASEKDGEAVASTMDDNEISKEALKLRRPLRKVSRFDPNPTGTIKKSWEKQAIPAGAGQDENAGGPKINTVEKSRMDWAAYVDSAGIKDELRVHSKAKEGFLGRMDFLDRVDAKREDERRNARLKGR